MTCCAACMNSTMKSVQLLGREHLINELVQFVPAFDMKLRLWETQLRNANYVHFPTLMENEPASPYTYVAFVELLRREFADRFTDFRAHSWKFLVFSNPLQVEVDGAPEAVQMELIELQCSAAMKATSQEVPLVEFYRMHLPTEQFPALIKYAKIIASLFGNTYVCEQLFSKMIFVKCKTRTQLTDGHLDDALRHAGTSLLPAWGA